MSQQVSVRSATSLGLASYPIAANLPRIGSSLAVIGPDLSHWCSLYSGGQVRFRSASAVSALITKVPSTGGIAAKAVRMRRERRK